MATLVSHHRHPHRFPCTNLAPFDLTARGARFRFRGHSDLKNLLFLWRIHYQRKLVFQW